MSLSFITHGQDTISHDTTTDAGIKFGIGGFIRAGFYTWTDKTDKKLYIPTAFSDFGIKADAGNRNFRAFADMRVRYGSEFSNPVTRFDFREAYVSVNGRTWDLTAGQRIIKWGRADFTNPTSKLSPQNFISRSPDREDMDLGNLLAALNWHPSPVLNLEAVVVPYYRSSTLIIDPVPLPANVEISQINSLVTDSKMFGYALKADLHLHGFDWSLSWFDGYDPMPGIALTKFNLDLSQPVPVSSIGLTVTPYKTRMLGTDFETTLGGFGIRGEAAWTMPSLSFRNYEYVPMPEIKWVAGTDWTSGIWRFIIEYSGKYITDFAPSTAGSLIGTVPDYAQLAEIMALPGFDPENYAREQVGAFNRLYNFQLDRFNHSAGFRAEAEMAYGRVIPSVFAMYNFTTRDLMAIPEIKVKPADGLAVSVGAELYQGRQGSLYNLVKDFMDGVYFSIRVDF
ncbi:MAG: hypothetical protein WCE64_09575 [Bacteroidales bacterium]